ncbi:MAG: aminotransferase class I/II-fold pyridoxal phosphate-dependent enzyme [Caldilineaceae bacterium]|nr:aminotransferase class I/II-fold pyridoxal phosphate-dependent enzyme [Caldilineaceae bacterium]
MTQSFATRRMDQIARALTPFINFLSDSAYVRLVDKPGMADFVFGNPQEMPLPAFVQSLQTWTVPQHKDWFAYNQSMASAQAAVAAALSVRRGQPFAPEDISMTNGAFAGLAVCLMALIDPGDEVIYISPPWFFYEAMIVAYGGTPVRVQIDRATLDLDLDAIAQAITPRTRAIIVNSPHNPTGKVYSPATLTALGDILSQAGAQHGRPIYLLSDEAYHRILFDGRSYRSPTQFYSHSLIIYTYGKTLLTPGQRIGYIALPPDLPGRAEIGQAIFAAQTMVGYAFPNNVLQYALPELEEITLDLAHLQAKRDRMVAGLRAAGYALHVPEGTFYLLVKSPWEDDIAFCDLLGEHDILTLPGSVCEMPGYFRISLTAGDGMIDRALPGFAEAYAESREDIAQRS